MTLQNKMKAEQSSKDIFDQAKTYALDYSDAIATRSVFPSEESIEGLSVFDEDMPTAIGNASHILDQLHNYGAPASTAQTGGRYFGFVTGGALPVGLATRWITDFWDQNSGLYLMSPISSTLETVTERWLRGLFGLPDNVVASFLSGTSMAIFCGLAAARHRIYSNQGWDFTRQGHRGAPAIRIVAGSSAHGAVIKAVALLGFGLDHIEWVTCDEQGRLILDDLPTLDSSTIVLLQAGNVNTGSFDPIDQVCRRANEAGSWVHIDGAFGLWAGATSQLKSLTKGMEKAQSWSVDGHKTLNTPYDNGILLCADQEALVAALQASGSYLAYSEHRDGMLYTPEMSRRARVIELWATLKYLGSEGVDELVFGLHERAVQFATELKEQRFDVINDVVFNQVLIGFDRDDSYTLGIVNHIQNSGDCWVGTSVWNGKKVIRISVCSWATTENDVTRSVKAFRAARTAMDD
ncbi:MAG: glutamate/tyrosine decarboxylase-like PLP-dependent enzyme [Porticoccaceae bacterium]|jgi:glutamate/tyrosine decarboxylase-like PLP-dependent enzyme